MNFLILLVVFVAVAFRLTKPDDRKRYAALAIAQARQLKVIATTQGAAGPVRAESVMYDIQPGAPAVGVITVTAVP